MTETIIKNFEVKQTTFVFVILTIVTLGFYYCYWLLSTTRRVNSNAVAQKINDVPVIVFCAVSAAAGIITDTLLLMCAAMRTSWAAYYTLCAIFFLAVFGLGIFISLKLAAGLKSVFKQAGADVAVTTWAAVILQGYYLYYFVRNRKELNIIEEDDDD